MNENTIGNDMPRTVTPKPAEPELLGEVVSKLKLFKSDHDLAVNTQKQVQVLFRQITIQEILRDAIHAGLPVVIQKYTAAIEAAKNADKD